MSDINQTPRDKDGKRHGEWIAYHDNGKLWYSLNFVHGIAHGLHEGYYKNGKLSYRGYWNMDIKASYWLWFGEKRYYLCLI